MTIIFKTDAMTTILELKSEMTSSDDRERTFTKGMGADFDALKAIWAWGRLWKRTGEPTASEAKGHGEGFDVKDEALIAVSHSSPFSEFPGEGQQCTCFVENFR